MIYCEECDRVYDKMEECTFHSVVIKTIQYSLPDLEKGNYEMEIFCPCYLCPRGHKIEIW